MSKSNASISAPHSGPKDFLGSEYIILNPAEAKDAAFVRSRETWLLMRAELRRLQLQAEWLVPVTFGYDRPGRGFARTTYADGSLRLGFTADYHPVCPKAGYLDDESGAFVEFPELRIERADKRPQRFDEWWQGQLKDVEFALSRMLSPAEALSTIQAIAADAYREGRANAKTQNR